MSAITTMAMRISTENYAVALAVLGENFHSVNPERVIDQVLVINDLQPAGTDNRGRTLLAVTHFWAPVETFEKDFHVTVDMDLNYHSFEPVDRLPA